MNTNTTSQTTAPSSGAIEPKIIIRLAVFWLIVMGILFLSAGTLNWLWGWIYSGLIIGGTMISRWLMLRANPGLAAERVKSLRAEDAKSWDKFLSPVLAIYGPVLTMVVAGLDYRFGLTEPLSLTARLIALGIIVLAYAFSTWAMIVNQFFSGTVRIQEDRGHHVIDSGPYRIIRHPGYTGGLLSSLATPFLLGTLWALIPVGLTGIVYIIRTALEDRTLQEELPGYREYAQKTRYRLLPGIW